MRTCNRNKTKLYYALFEGSKSVTESYTDADGNTYELDTGDDAISYSDPKEFYGNIATSGGTVQQAEYGLDFSQYSAILVVSKNTLPIDEKSLIWHTSEPRWDADGKVDGTSADYEVVKVSNSINECKYILKKLVTEDV